MRVWTPRSVGTWTCEKKSSSNLAYSERLVNLGLDRLELPRLRFDLIYVY